MRNKIYLAIALLIAYCIPSYATDYTFNGFGDWTDESNWNGDYPGTTLNNGDNIFIEGDCYIFESTIVDNNGAIIINGGSSLSARGTFNINNNGSLSAIGNFSVEGGITNNYGTIDIYSDFFAGWAEFNNYGTFTSNDGSSIGINLIFFNKNGAEFTQNSLSMTIYDGGIINNQPTAEFINNGNIYTTGPINNAGVFYNNSGAILELSYLAIFFNTGSFVNGSGATFNLNTAGGQSATFKGYSWTNLGNFNSSGGKIAPGSSTGLMHITGSLNLTSTTYNCQIFGSTQGTSYDLLEVNDDVILTGGSLVVDWGNYTPLGGTIYTILSSGDLIGVFSSVTIPAVSGLTFQLTYTGTEVQIEAELLPVEMTSFKARLLDNSVQLDWQTATEINNEGFYLERSNNGINWQILSFIEGHGTSFNFNNYSYNDINPFWGINYYRLFQKDFGGKSEYSKVIQIEISGKNKVEIFPNPTTGTIKLRGLSDTIEKFILTNVEGKVVKEFSDGINQIDISEFQEGLYYLNIIVNNHNEICPILKVK